MESDLAEYDGLIKWALHHSILKYALVLDPATEFSDLVQTTYLRLLGSLSRRERPEHMPPYVVRSARRVVSDIVRDRSRQKNIFSEDAPEMMGRVNRRRKVRIERRATVATKEEARRRASEARWKGHDSARSQEALAKHAEAERRRRARKRIEEAGEVGIPRSLEKRARTKKSREDRMRQQKEYRTAKMGAMGQEDREAAKEYHRRKQAEYRRRRKRLVGAASQPGEAPDD